jgi:hypothetical protein
MQLPTIDQLVFKGGHNSYACDEQTNPDKPDPPEVQVDAYGVWTIELDVSAEGDPANLVAKVGHDEAGDPNAHCWGGRVLLTEFLEPLRGIEALRYRPIFIYFDYHYDQWGVNRNTPAGQAAIRDAVMKAVFDTFPDAVVLSDWVAEHGYPTVPELAGKVVVYATGNDIEVVPGGLSGWTPSQDLDVESDVVEEAVAAAEAAGRGIALRIDRYADEWTFELGVPPNPLHVDQSSSNAAETGTGRSPYRSLQAAVARSSGITAFTGGAADPRRAGHGWTLLVVDGQYSGPLTVDIPLTIRRNGTAPGGKVVVG